MYRSIPWKLPKNPEVEVVRHMYGTSWLLNRMILKRDVTAAGPSTGDATGPHIGGKLRSRAGGGRPSGGRPSWQ